MRAVAPKQIPFQVFPSLMLKKLICFIFIESIFLVFSIPWDLGRIKLYLSCNIYSGIIQRAGYYNVRGTNPAPSLLVFVALI